MVEVPLERFTKCMEDMTCLFKEIYMKYLPYIWTVVTNLIALLIVFAIFDAVYGSFETIILSLLVLIYISLVSLAGGFGQTKMREILVTNQEFKRLRRLLKEEQSEDEVLDENEDVENAKAQMKKVQAKFYINSGFNLFIFTIAIINLLGSL